MDEKSKTELDVLVAADRWAREVLRADRVLNHIEQDLLNAVMQYQRLARSVDTDMYIEIPRPPDLPQDLNYTTKRYSEISTVPIPLEEMQTDTDIDQILEPLKLDEEDLWNGTGKPKPE